MLQRRRHLNITCRLLGPSIRPDHGTLYLLLFVAFGLGPHWPQTMNAREPDDATLQCQDCSEITRDAYGIPTIVGKRDVDVIFSLMVAHAEDNFDAIEWNLVQTMGRSAEWIGSKGLAADLRRRLYLSHQQARELLELASPEFRQWCQAWADGLNSYLDANPNRNRYDGRPSLIEDFEPWMVLTLDEASIGGTIEQVDLSLLAKHYGLQDPEADDLHTTEPGLLGSNAIAIAGSRTANGKALLLINPHTPFHYRGEAHLTCDNWFAGQTLNCRGAITWGQFTVFQGFNDHFAWSHTSAEGADTVDAYYLTTRTQKNGKIEYRFADQWQPIETRPVELKVNDGDQIKTTTLVTHHSHHGPVTHLDSAGRWCAMRRYVDPVAAITQAMRTMSATSVHDFHEVMSMRTNQSNHTMVADTDGNIALFVGNFFPDRDDKFNFSVAVDGSDPRTDWRGKLPMSQCLVVENPTCGWLQNCNATPFRCAGDDSPSRQDSPGHLGQFRESLRGRNAVRMLSEQSEFSVESLIEIALDKRLPFADAVVPTLVKELNEYLDSAKSLSNDKRDKLLHAARTLTAWDRCVTIDSHAMVLLTEYFRQFGRTVKRIPAEPDFLGYLQNDFNPATPLIKATTMLAAIKQIANDFPDWRSVTWGQINRFQRSVDVVSPSYDDDQPSLAVPMTIGHFGILASYGSKRFDGSRRRYGTSGNSFMAVVEMGQPVKAKLNLAGGQSGDPASPHFDDQAIDFCQGRLRDVTMNRDGQD